VSVVIPFGNDGIYCGGGRNRLSEFFDIQTLGDEFSVVGQVLLCFAEVRLEGFYPMKSGFQVFRGCPGRGGTDVLLIRPIACLEFYASK